MSATLAKVSLSRETRGFVCATFASSFKRYSGLSDRRAFDGHVMAQFERALDANAPTILVLASSPDDFVGWSLVQGEALVYVYVKLAYRDRGIGRALLPDGLTAVVFQTPAGSRLQRSKWGHPLRSVPYLLHAEREAA